MSNPMFFNAEGPDARNSGLMTQGQGLGLDMSDPIFSDAEGNPFNKFSAGPDALKPGVMVPDQTLRHQLSAHPEGAVNVEKPSQMFPTPEPPRGSQPSPQRLRKREADQRYRAKQKQKMLDLEKEVLMLTKEKKRLADENKLLADENKRLKKMCAWLKKLYKQLTQKLNRNKGLNNTMDAQMKELYGQMNVL